MARRAAAGQGALGPGRQDGLHGRRAGRGRLGFAPGGQMLLHGLLVKLIGLTLDQLQGSGGAAAQAGPQAVAQNVADQFGLAVYNGQGSFGAVDDAGPATVALLFINLNYFANRHYCLL